MAEPTHTNRLARETSPYLLQHAHNPVDWYPWGEEALEAARSADRPILLSIGYSACHWCHVMERESFEDEETAALMNELFVNVKVDREERPDLDGIYMQAVQLMTGSGGWPMTVFLRPDTTPFYGGTYFPPTERYGMPSFKTVLRSVSDAYRERRDDVDESAGRILEAIRRAADMAGTGGDLSGQIFDDAFEALARSFEPRYGGWGGAPKFPAAMVLDFLLRYHARTKKPGALAMVEQTLDRMAAGGMYDQIGGGFARYSVDDRWLVPHFEKMLYDNALLARVYADAYVATGKARYGEVARETLDWVLREMISPEGAFYSSLDADSEGEEGKFYVWTPEELAEILGDEDARLAAAYFDVTEEGNFEGRSIPNTPRTREAVAGGEGVSVERLDEAIKRARGLLYEHRAKRVWPGLDDKTLTAWNALMLRAFAEAGAALGRSDYVEVAWRNADFLLEKLRRDGLLLRTYKAGEAKLNGYLEDYAYLVEALVSLYEASFEPKWLEEARQIADAMIAEFWDEEAGGFYFTGRSHEELLRRAKEYEDNATPSGNSSAAWGLARLAAFTGEERYGEYADAILRQVAGALGRYARAFGHMLSALDYRVSAPVEIAIVGSFDDQTMHELIAVAHRTYLPSRVLAAAAPDDKDSTDAIPLLRDRPLVDGQPAAYVCRNFVCKRPVTAAGELRAELASAQLGPD